MKQLNEIVNTAQICFEGLDLEMDDIGSAVKKTRKIFDKKQIFD